MNEPPLQIVPRPVDRATLKSEVDRLASLAPVDSADPVQRDLLANAMAAAVSTVVPPKFSGEPPNIASDLRNRGLVEVPSLRLDASKVAELRAHLEKEPVYAAHVAVFSDGVARKLENPESRKSPFGSYKLSQVVNAPHLLDLAFHPTALAIAENYLGCAPTIYSVHAWWSFPGHKKSGPQVFHRDPDDHRFLALFVYLTDVEGGSAGGEHEFIIGTHRLETTEASFPRDPGLAAELFPPRSLGTVADEGPLYRELFGDKVLAVTGKAGSVFVADTYGLHRGMPPTRSPRLVCWIRYGLRETPTYGSNQNHAVAFDWSSGRVPRDDYHRYVGRLILEG